MTRAFLDGLRRVLNAPTLVVGVYVVTLLTAAPLGLLVHRAIESHLGASVAAEAVANGVSWEWWEEFQAQATGVATTVRARIIGFAAVLSNQSDLVDGTPPQGEVMLAVAAYVGLWIFLVGGVIDRLARQRRVGTAAFFAVCGTFFFRFCRLALLAGATYLVLFGAVHGWLFETIFEATTQDLPVERTAFIIRVTLYAVFGLILLPVNLVFDYAKIRAVVEDRRSMLGAVWAAIRFIRRQPADAVGLYLLNGALFVAVVAAYGIAAPGAAGGVPSMLGFVVGQAYVGARLFTKLVFYASQTAYFQSRLAHAAYVAAPRPVWPDSPVVEAVGDVSR